MAETPTPNAEQQALLLRFAKLRRQTRVAKIGQAMATFGAAMGGESAAEAHRRNEPDVGGFRAQRARFQEDLALQAPAEQRLQKHREFLTTEERTRAIEAARIDQKAAQDFVATAEEAMRSKQRAASDSSSNQVRAGLARAKELQGEIELATQPTRATQDSAAIATAALEAYVDEAVEVEISKDKELQAELIAARQQDMFAGETATANADAVLENARVKHRAKGFEEGGAFEARAAAVAAEMYDEEDLGQSFAAMELFAREFGIDRVRLQAVDKTNRVGNAEIGALENTRALREEHERVVQRTQADAQVYVDTDPALAAASQALDASRAQTAALTGRAPPPPVTGAPVQGQAPQQGTPVQPSQQGAWDERPQETQDRPPVQEGQPPAQQAQGQPVQQEQPIQAPQGDGMEQVLRGLNIEPSDDTTERTIQILEAIQAYPQHPPLRMIKESILSGGLGAGPGGEGGFNFEQWSKDRGYDKDPDLAVNELVREAKVRNRQNKRESRRNRARNIAEGTAPASPMRKGVAQFKTNALDWRKGLLRGKKKKTAEQAPEAASVSGGDTPGVDSGGPT